MVVISASILTKTGKILLARQFVSVSRVRIEGLIAAFPKLLSSEKQHTFFETQSVRYVYQPLDNLYLVIITNKSSNMLEDIEVLSLLSKIVPEYCTNLSEEDILDHAYDIIFAFDEVISLGYREKLNMQQLRTCLEMDSHEEKIFEIVRRNKEREVYERTKEIQEKLEKERRENKKLGKQSLVGYNTSSISSDSFNPSSYVPSTKTEDYTKKKEPETKSFGSGLQLGSKNKTSSRDKFLQAIAKEEKIVIPETTHNNNEIFEDTSSTIKKESVHFEIKEDVTSTLDKEGVMKIIEVKGSLSLQITDPNNSQILIHVDNKAPKSYRMNTHPHIDKKKWKKNVIALKGSDKKFPVQGKKLPILKWRFASKSENDCVLQINAWPSVGSAETTVVNLEYILLDESKELTDLVINIPIPKGIQPVVQEAVGQYKYNSTNNCLTWSIPLVDGEKADGQMEFVIPDVGDNTLLFPITATFSCSKSFCDIAINKVINTNDENEVEFSQSPPLVNGEITVEFE